jgi:DNA polymerase III delta subunit
MTALLVTGNEEYLRAQAVRAFLASPRATEPDLVVTFCVGAETNAHDIHEHLGPSLFGGFPTLHIIDAHKLSKDALGAALGYVNDPACALILEVAKPAEAGGKALVTAATKAGAQVEAVQQPKSAKDKKAFAVAQMREHGLRPAAGADAALADGEADLRGIATRVAQLADDHTTADGQRTTTITAEHVATVATTAAVTGFVVADALAARNPARLVTAVRDALDAGAAPLFIQAACLSTLRDLAALASGGPTRMPPWKAQQLRPLLRQWNAATIAKAMDEMGVIGEAVRSSVKTQNDLMAALLRAIA